MNKIVCIDAHIAVWGIKGEGDVAQIEKTRIPPIGIQTNLFS